MKKKIGLMLMAALVVLTGCLNDNDNSDYEKFRPVEPGLSIYNAATTQNAMAMQPGDIALRFAVLYSEAVKQNKLDQLNLIFVPNYGNVKTLLLGANTKITENNGVYDIAYAGSGGMMGYDHYARLGTVRVDTRGLALENTDVENQWKVTLVSEKLLVSSNTRDVTLTSTGNTVVYCTEEGYQIEFRDVVSYINHSIQSKWSGKFVLTAGEEKDLSFSALIKVAFGMNGSSSGSSFWTLNNTTSLGLSYSVSNGKYNPSEVSSIRIMGGVEECRLINPADYPAEVYPSPDVKLTWSYKDKRLSYVVDYNGHSLEVSF